MKKTKMYASKLDQLVELNTFSHLSKQVRAGRSKLQNAQYGLLMQDKTKQNVLARVPCAPQYYKLKLSPQVRRLGR